MNSGFLLMLTQNLVFDRVRASHLYFSMLPHRQQCHGRDMPYWCQWHPVAYLVSDNIGEICYNFWDILSWYQWLSEVLFTLLLLLVRLASQCCWYQWGIPCSPVSLTAVRHQTLEALGFFFWEKKSKWLQRNNPGQKNRSTQKLCCKYLVLLFLVK